MVMELQTLTQISVVSAVQRARHNRLWIAARRLALVSVFVGLSFGSAGADVKPLSFTPWEDPTGIEFSGGTVGFPMAPSHGLFGFLHMDSYAEGDFPLQVQFAFSIVEAPQDRMSAPVAMNGSFHWGQPAVLMGARRRSPPVCVVTERVTIEDRAKPLPVLNAPIDLNYYQANVVALRAIDVKIFSKAGQVLGEQRLINGFMPGYDRGSRGAITMDEPEADRVFQEASLAPTKKTSILPPILPFYFSSSAVWISPAGLEASKLDRDFYRRLILMGKQLVARDKTAPELARLIGVQLNRGIFQGGVFAAREITQAHTQNFMTDESGMVYRGAYRGPETDNKKREPDFWEAAPISKKRVGSLGRYTLIFLGLFVLAQAVIMMWGLSRVSRSQRLQYWFWVPVVSLAFALVGGGLAPVLINLKPSSEALDVTYSYADWNEALTETHLSCLYFSSKGFDWKLPEDALVDGYPDNPFAAANGLRDVRTYYDLSEEDGGSRLRVSPGRGEILRARFFRWIRNDVPCVVKAPDQIEFRQNFSKVWFWNGTNWKDLGAVAKGDVKDVRKAKILFENKAESGPNQWMAERYEPAESLPGRVAALFRQAFTSDRMNADEAVLVGLSPDNSSAVPSWEPLGDFQSASIRVHRFPLKGGSGS